MGTGLETADDQRMAGALVEQRDDLAVDLVDLGTMFLNLRKGGRARGARLAGRDGDGHGPFTGVSNAGVGRGAAARRAAGV